MPKKPSAMPELGNKFGRPDLERIGLFVEMPYLSAKRAKPAKKESEGRNIYCEGRKTKNGTQHGYFDDTFRRIYSKEALRGRGRKPEPPKFTNISERPFVPPSGGKAHSTPGDQYGTFSGKIDAFSNKPRPKPPYQHEEKNFVTSLGRKGGPGYADICLNPYPDHLPDRYGLKPKYKEYGQILGRPLVPVHHPQPCFDLNPFKEREGTKPGPTYVRPKEKVQNVIPPGHILPTGPAKRQGGCHDGCFNKFPEHKSDRRPKPLKGKETAASDQVFYPQSTAMKSFYTTSVLNQNVDFRMSSQNFNSFQPSYVKYLISE